MPQKPEKGESDGNDSRPGQDHQPGTASSVQLMHQSQRQRRFG